MRCCPSLAPALFPALAHTHSGPPFAPTSFICSVTFRSCVEICAESWLASLRLRIQRLAPPSNGLQPDPDPQTEPNLRWTVRQLENLLGALSVSGGEPFILCVSSPTLLAAQTAGGRGVLHLLHSASMAHGHASDGDAGVWQASKLLGERGRRRHPRAVRTLVEPQRRPAQDRRRGQHRSPRADRQMGGTLRCRQSDGPPQGALLPAAGGRYLSRDSQGETRNREAAERLRIFASTGQVAQVPGAGTTQSIIWRDAERTYLPPPPLDPHWRGMLRDHAPL